MKCPLRARTRTVVGVAWVSVYRVRRSLKSCPVPIHAIAFPEDLPTPPSIVKAVADLAMNGRYHEVPGLGHVSVARHAQDTVNSLLLEIIAAEVQLDPET